MKLSRLTIPYRAARNSGSILLIFLFSSSASLQELGVTSLVFFALGTGLLMLLNLFWAYLVWKNYSYMLEEESLKLKHGVMRKKDRKIPLKRIQNVDIQRNIFQRALGIASLSIETAGGGQTEASLKYLDQEKARELRDRLRGKSKTSEESDEKDSLYEITDRELLILAGTSVDGRVIAAVTAIFGFAPGLIGFTTDGTDLGVTAGFSLLLAGAVGLTWISSAVSTFLKYWGFRLYDREDSLEYERGLLNRSEGSIPLGKIQKLTLEENILKRTLGYGSLKIDTAGYSPRKSTEIDSEAAVPIARKEKALRLAEQIEGIEKPVTQNISPVAKTRYIMRYLLASVLISSTLLVASGRALIGLTTLGILLVTSAIAGHVKWSNRGYQIAKNHVLTVNGFWNRKTNFIPYYRVQNLIETTTFLQRRWNLSTLDIDTAGTGNLLNRTAIIDLDRETTSEVKNQVYNRFQDSVR